MLQAGHVRALHGSPAGHACEPLARVVPDNNTRLC
jgi:hypothetical protein